MSEIKKILVLYNYFITVCCKSGNATGVQLHCWNTALNSCPSWMSPPARTAVLVCSHWRPLSRTCCPYDVLKEPSFFHLWLLQLLVLSKSSLMQNYILQKKKYNVMRTLVSAETAYVHLCVSHRVSQKNKLLVIKHSQNISPLTESLPQCYLLAPPNRLGHLWSSP